MRQTSHSRQKPWDGEAADLNTEQRAHGGGRARRGRQPRRSKYPSTLLTGTLLVAAALGAGALIYPDRAADLLRGSDWTIKPSAAWSAIFPERTASPRVLAAIERAPAATPSAAPAQDTSRPVVATPAMFKAAADQPQATANVTTLKSAARDLPWLPESEKSAEAPAAEPAQIAPRAVVAAPEGAPTAPAPRAAPPAPLTEEIAALIKLARGRIDIGDIAGARLLLERAASGREPNALMALAETYDPAMLERWGARGLKGDLGKARGLYQAAAESGLAEARTRVLAVR